MFTETGRRRIGRGLGCWIQIQLHRFEPRTQRCSPWCTQGGELAKSNIIHHKQPYTTSKRTNQRRDRIPLVVSNNLLFSNGLLDMSEEHPQQRPTMAQNVQSWP